MNNSYQQRPLLELVQPAKAIGCNQCWYPPFTGGPHQYVWVGYKLTILRVFVCGVEYFDV